MLFAEIDSQGGRSTPTSLQSTPFPSLHATSFALAQQAVVSDLWMWRTLVARHALSHPPVRTEHTPIDLTHTLLDFPLPGAQLHFSAGPHLPTPHATAARDHTPNEHRLYDCSSCPSVHRECGDRVTSITPVVVPFPRWDQYPLTIISSLALDVRVSPQMKPKQLHRVREFQGVANRLVTATMPYLLTRFGIASISFTFVSRSLGHSFTFSSASCPGGILSGDFLRLANANSATAIAFFARFLLS